MIPPASHSVRVYPGLKLSTTIRATLYDAAAERRTLEELRSKLAVIEQKICNSSGTSQQCRDWNKEKRQLSEAIKAKEIAEGFTNGSLVPYLEERQGQEICSFVPAPNNRRQIRKAKSYTGRVVRAHRRELNESNFDGNADVVRAKSEDQKTVNLLSGRSYCSLQEGST